MPVLLQGSCHCRKVKYTVESNTPVPFVLCQCSICRKTGGYMGSVNIMGNTDTLKVHKGRDLIKEYRAVLEFDKDDKPTELVNGVRSFCGECSAMLWNYDSEWPHWIYPFASSIDAPNPLAAIPKGYKMISIMRDSCPCYVPLPEGVKGQKGYGDMEGIEVWHKKSGAWVD